MKKIITTIVVASFLFALSGVSFATLSFDNDPAFTAQASSITGYSPVVPPQPKKGVAGYSPVVPPQPKKGVAGYSPVVPPQPKKGIAGYSPVVPPQPKK